MAIDLTVWCNECKQLDLHQWYPLAEICSDSPVRVFKLTRMSQQKQRRYNETYDQMPGTSGLLYPRRTVRGAQMLPSKGSWHVQVIHHRLHQISDPHYLDAMPLKCQNDHYLVLSYTSAEAILKHCEKTEKRNVYLKARARQIVSLSLCDLCPDPPPPYPIDLVHA